MITETQNRVLTLLAEGSTLTAAAEAAGIHRNTIRNWRATLPAFAAEMDNATRAQAQAWREEAVNAVPTALQAILAVLNDPEASASLRLRAAGMILKMADLHNAAQSARPPHIAPVVPLRETASFCAPRKPEIVHNPAQSSIRKVPEPGRNSQCPCGSGQKYKRCCASVAQFAQGCRNPGEAVA